MAEFSDLVGKVLKSVTNLDGQEIVFETVDGDVFVQLHHWDCCENVYVESIVGDLEDLVGTPILLAEEDSNSLEGPPGDRNYVESYTWTFYKLRTIKGSVDIRWFGESNGYYSESVDFIKRGA